MRKRAAQAKAVAKWRGRGAGGGGGISKGGRGRGKEDGGRRGEGVKHKASKWRIRRASSKSLQAALAGPRERSRGGETGHACVAPLLRLPMPASPTPVLLRGVALGPGTPAAGGQPPSLGEGAGSAIGGSLN